MKVRSKNSHAGTPDECDIVRSVAAMLNTLEEVRCEVEMKAQDILNKAASHMKDRAATYDSTAGERSMGKTVAMLNTLYGTELTEEQGWAFMAILKMVRTSQGKYRADNYEDGVAYFSLMGEAADAEAKESVEDADELLAAWREGTKVNFTTPCTLNDKMEQEALQTK